MILGSVSAMDAENNTVSSDDLNAIEDTIVSSNPVDDSLSVKDVENSITSGSDSLYVSPKGSDSNGDGSSENPYQSLKHAIEQSSNGSTIYLADGNYSGKNNRNLTIDKSLSIVGNSRDKVIIDGENIARIFIINSPIAVKLDSMTLINGYEAPVKTTPEGGAIYSYGASLTLNKVTVKNSNGNDNGGAVYNYLGSLTVIDSDFINNQAKKKGGALFTAGVTVIRNSRFISNKVTDALNGVGGAIMIAGSGLMENSLFEKNRADYSVGGICNSGNITINNCSFINQSCRYAGGAISNHNTAVINNSYFKDVDGDRAAGVRTLQTICPRVALFVSVCCPCLAVLRMNFLSWFNVGCFFLSIVIIAIVIVFQRLVSHYMFHRATCLNCQLCVLMLLLHFIAATWLYAIVSLVAIQLLFLWYNDEKE